MVFVALQRYGISSKSQQPSRRELEAMRCLWPYKGMEFLANHNGVQTKYKQTRVFVALQRYGISSKSQHTANSKTIFIRCLWPYKGMEFLANHN